jgi:hypothetical protein
MKLILLILILLFILIILRLFVVKEGFENISLNPTTIQGYDKFLSFYTFFCANWKKAIISSVASEIQQIPATDPKNPVTGNAPDISEQQMNDYITNLSHSTSYILPPICKSLPSIIDSTNIDEITKNVPTDIQSYINALNWMNQQLEKSQAHLGSALQGSRLHTEHFQDMCQNIASCLENNPQLIKQLALELSEKDNQNIIEKQEKLMTVINPFLINSELLDAFSKNKVLIEKAQKIQEQAQSGELLNQINVPGGRTIAKYQLPDGANKLNDIKQNNPDRYNELKQNYSKWTDLKGMIDNINANL